MAQCKIMLDNYIGNYNAGDKMNGNIECFFDGEVNCRAIKLRLRGREYCEWMDTEEYLDPDDQKYKTRTVQFTGDHDFCSVEQIVFGSESGQNYHIPRGRHVFPFIMRLPGNLPSSFRGKYGSVTFELQAVVDRPMAFDYTDVFLIKVTSLVDLNRFAECSFDELTLNDEKTVCCLCCRGGLVNLDVKLPKIAFISGEIINFQVHINNMSNQNVRKLICTLIKTLDYKVETPSNLEKTETEQLAEVIDHGVGAHGEHLYNLQIGIPGSVEINNFSSCSLFRAKYFLKVVADMPRCSINLAVDCELSLGHIQKGQGPPPKAPTYLPYFQSGDHYNQPPFGFQHGPPHPGPGIPYPEFPAELATIPIHPTLSDRSIPPGRFLPSSNAASGDNQPMEGADTAPTAPPELPPPSYAEAQEKARK